MTDRQRSICSIDGAVKSSNHSLEDKDTCGFAGKGDRVNKNPKVRNLAQTGWALVHAALDRQESRGAHSRTDFPHPSPDFLVRLVVS